MTNEVTPPPAAVACPLLSRFLADMLPLAAGDLLRRATEVMDEPDAPLNEDRLRACSRAQHGLNVAMLNLRDQAGRGEPATDLAPLAAEVWKASVTLAVMAMLLATEGDANWPDYKPEEGGRP